MLERARSAGFCTELCDKDQVLWHYLTTRPTGPKNDVQHAAKDLAIVVLSCAIAAALLCRVWALHAVRVSAPWLCCLAVPYRNVPQPCARAPVIAIFGLTMFSSSFDTLSRPRCGQEGGNLPMPAMMMTRQFQGQGAKHASSGMCSVAQMYDMRASRLDQACALSSLPIQSIFASKGLPGDSAGFCALQALGPLHWLLVSPSSQSPPIDQC